MNSLNTKIKTIESKAFGPFWDTMFLISLGFPDEPSWSDKSIYKTFYFIFVNLIPCGVCRHYASTKLPPLDFSSREQLFFSLYQWKSEVNAKRGVPNISFNDAKQKYYKYRLN